MVLFVYRITKILKNVGQQKNIGEKIVIVINLHRFHVIMGPNFVCAIVILLRTRLVIQSIVKGLDGWELDFLDKLVSLLLLSGRHKFAHTTKYLGNNEQVFAKGVYPYAYMTGPDKFEESQLPPIETFYNTLDDEPCPQENCCLLYTSDAADE